MLQKGISLYPGMGYPLEICLQYLEDAKQAGFSRLFTSLHIPEADAGTLLPEFRQIVGRAATLGFRITADISPRGFQMLGVSENNLNPLREIGLSALRLDFGFSTQEIASYCKDSGLQIEINASTVDETLLMEILAGGIDAGQLEACHNYYPRPDTGLSYELFKQRSQLFQAYSIPVAAFVPSRLNPRGPLHAGLPTLEKHRCVNSLQAAKELAYSGLVDAVLLGDPLADKEELTGIGAIEEDCVALQIVCPRELSQIENKILLANHVNRQDPGEFVIRSADARSLANGEIAAMAGLPRLRGSVTIDNVLYKRYMGELQIIRKDLPPDEKVNVVATVIPEETELMDMIQPGGKFRFVIQKEGR